MSNLNMSVVESWLCQQSQEFQEFPFWGTASDDQKIAMYAICSGQYDVVALAGRAGSGKTWVAKAAKNLLKLQGCEVRVTASTGIAARNANGEGTLNKFAGLRGGNSTLPLGLSDDTNGEHWRRSSVQRRADDVSQNFDTRAKSDLVVFIDEYSMVSSENLILTVQILQQLCRNRRLRVILTGDFRQLLVIDKVNAELPWKEYISWAFDPARFNPAGSGDTLEYPSILSSGDVDPSGKRRPWRTIGLSLMTNHRQSAADGWFIEALNALGDGHDFTHPQVQPLGQRVWLDQGGKCRNMVNRNALPDLSKAIHLYNTNAEVSKHNRETLDLAIAEGRETKEYRAYVEAGTWDRAAILQEVAPLEETMTLAVGLKFMVRVNLNAELTNGTVGVITKLNPESIELELPNGTLHSIQVTSIPLPRNRRGIAVGKFEAIPGVLCHAMTPWKAQGLTIDEPLVYHLNRWGQTHGLMNVVCTRVTRPEYLYIVADSTKKLNNAIHCEPAVQKFIQQQEMVMQQALGQVVWPSPWADAGDHCLWVRDYQVNQVEYTPNPKGEVLEDNDLCTFFSLGDLGGMLIKEPELIGQRLLEDDNAFEWFRENIQYVWFLPEEIRQAG